MKKKKKKSQGELYLEYPNLAAFVPMEKRAKEIAKFLKGLKRNGSAQEL